MDAKFGKWQAKTDKERKERKWATEHGEETPLKYIKWAALPAGDQPKP